MRRTVVTSATLPEVHRGNPLQVVEHLATSHVWEFERTSDDELNVVVWGKWADYQVLLTWMCDVEALHLACTFERHIPLLDQELEGRAVSLCQMSRSLAIGEKR